VIRNRRSGPGSPRSRRYKSASARSCWQGFTGARRSNDPAGQRGIIDALAAPYESYSFDDAAADIHARVRVDFERKGIIIGPLDLLIASIAVANRVTLVTHNTGEFSRVAGLSIVDWEIS
jgi:tRNA(fMet)-specific endonuclease VapC